MHVALLEICLRNTSDISKFEKEIKVYHHVIETFVNFYNVI